LVPAEEPSVEEVPAMRARRPSRRGTTWMELEERVEAGRGVEARTAGKRGETRWRREVVG